MSPCRRIEAIALRSFPLVSPGDDVGELIADSLRRNRFRLKPTDVIVVASIIIARAEGRIVRRDSVQPSAKARKLAAKCGKDPHLVEWILRESVRVSRVAPGVLITQHRLGFTCANAGIDHSNVGGSPDLLALLPEDPDRSARCIRETLHRRLGSRCGILVSDSHGRPFRLGTVGVAVGCAGIRPLLNRCGEKDLFGALLRATEIALADEMAAAANLVMGEAAEGQPVVLIRGLEASGKGPARDVVRPEGRDLYR